MTCRGQLAVLLLGVLGWGPRGSMAIRLFFLGDSMMDTGNSILLKNYSFQHANDHPPYGIDLNGTLGRWCNGRVITDFASAKAGIPTPPPALRPGANFQHGANFAVAGATVIDNPPLRTTILTAKKQFQLLSSILGAENTTGPLTDAVAYLNFGGSDIPMLLLLPASVVANRVVTGLTKLIVDLHGIGIRNFVVDNIAPLGCIPMARSAVLGLACFEPLNKLAIKVNVKLEAAVSGLRARFADSAILLFDHHAGWIEAGRIMGIPTSQPQCCGWPPPQRILVECGLPPVSFCSNRSSNLHWDNVHQTERFNEIEFDLAWGGDSKYIRPYNISMLYASL